MNQPSMQELVMAYRASGKGKDLIMERVAELVYSAHGRFGFDDEDAAADALMKHRGRILKLVERFEDRGIPFDSCLASSLRYLAKTVRRERKQAADREQVCEGAVMGEGGTGGQGDSGALPPWDAEGIFGAEAAAARPVPRRRPRARGGIARCGAAERAAFSSRLVYLAIKCAWEIDDAGIARVALAAGLDRAWLAAAVEQARRSLQSERSRVAGLVERRNASWCRQRLLEGKLGAETDPYRRSKLAASLERERSRCAGAKRELETLRTVVSNSVVARILGVPKGTVDSGLYYLRKRHEAEPAGLEGEDAAEDGAEA